MADFGVMISAFLLVAFFNQDAEPMCFTSDVRTLCCPSACAVKKSPKWDQADSVLRACMRGIGCSESDSKGATVFMQCNCPKTK